MITCKVCRSQVSRNAAACPKCGEPPPIANFSNSLPDTIIGMVMFVVLLYGAFWAMGLIS